MPSKHDVSWVALFADDITKAGNTVLGSKCFYRELGIIQNLSGPCYGMKMQGKGQGGTSCFQLEGNDFFQWSRCVQMQWIIPTQQAHAGEEAYQTEIVIPMKVRDEYMVDLTPADFVAGHLHLRAFPAINQE